MYDIAGEFGIDRSMLFCNNKMVIGLVAKSKPVGQLLVRDGHIVLRVGDNTEDPDVRIPVDED